VPHLRRFLSVLIWLVAVCLAPTSFGQQTQAVKTPIDGPDALAMDGEGRLFISSLYENNVRRVDLETGATEIVAGDGKDCCYHENSKATDVSLSTVWAIAVNSSGDLFISEGETIRKVDARTGLISTVAGNGESGTTDEGLLATSTSFVQIWSLAVDSDDNLFAADKAQGKVFKIETAGGSTGRVFRVAGNGSDGFAGDGGPALDASFSSLGPIALDKQNDLIIGDENNCRIRRVGHDTGIIDTVVITELLASCHEQAKSPASLMPSPTSLAIDSDGNVVFAETARDVVLIVSPRSGASSILVGDGQGDFADDGGFAPQAALDGPGGLLFDANGDLLIADIGNNRVRLVDAKTKAIRTIAGNGLPKVRHGWE
jgi:trimeric autotransporter adhesin